MYAKDENILGIEAETWGVILKGSWTVFAVSAWGYLVYSWFFTSTTDFVEDNHYYVEAIFGGGIVLLNVFPGFVGWYLYSHRVRYIPHVASSLVFSVGLCIALLLAFMVSLFASELNMQYAIVGMALGVLLSVYTFGVVFPFVCVLGCCYWVYERVAEDGYVKQQHFYMCLALSAISWILCMIVGCIVSLA